MNRHGVPGEPGSYWIATTPGTKYPSLKEEIRVDSAVLGGGIAGITAAKMLKDAGQKVAIIEAGRIVEGVTGHTTAHISSSQGFHYKHLIDSFGEDKARICAESCLASIEKIVEMVQRNGIDCDLARPSEYFYAERSEDADRLRDEYHACMRLGLPVSFKDSAPLPFENYGAVQFADQAQFHPRKYLISLAELIHGDGSFIFENTRASGVKEGEGSCIVKTDAGDLKATDVIVATHFPILNNGMLFARMEPIRSYVLGIEVEGDVPREMFYSTDEPCHYIRTLPTAKGCLVILGGEDHPVGHVTDTADRYRRLEKFAGERFKVRSVKWSWSTQDNYTFDRVPFIGRFPESDHIYVATGFKGTGMTYATVAGMLLSDIITKGESPWQDLYNPGRFKLTAEGVELVKRNVHVAETFVLGRGAEIKDISKMKNEDAGIAEVHGQKIAVYKDDEGEIHAVKPACAHMGCFVSWNGAERSWDCPCHGSRYDYYGQVIQSPATANLERIKRSDIE